MSDVLKTAVIGTGYLGTFHAEKYASSEKSDLVAVVDIVNERVTSVATRLGTKGLNDYRELPSLGVQCVSVASDTVTHYQIAKWLLENGIDVLVEKPMATNSNEAKDLVDTARKERRILQVSHLERFNPAVCAVRKILTRPMFFEVRRISPFKNRGLDVDVVLDLMIHDIDIVTHLVGRPVVKVEAIGVPVLTNTVDIANVRLQFEGGAVANFSASRAAFKTERTLRIFQPDIYISLDYATKAVKIYTKTGQSDALGMEAVSIAEHQVEERDALEDEIESFLNCVSDRSVPEVTGEDGLRALELVSRIEKAFEKSRLAFEVDKGTDSLLHLPG